MIPDRVSGGEYVGETVQSNGQCWIQVEVTKKWGTEWLEISTTLILASQSQNKPLIFRLTADLSAELLEDKAT